MENAIALLELKSISKGLFILDEMLKKAEVNILYAEPFSAGKFFILINGNIAEIEEAYRKGLQLADVYLVDHLFIQDTHPTLLPAIEGTAWENIEESCAIIETYTIASTIKGADIAAKAADIKLIKVALGKGIGGKGYFTLAGPLHFVEAAVDNAKNYIESEGSLIQYDIIANPQPEIFNHLS